MYKFHKYRYIKFIAICLKSIKFSVNVKIVPGWWFQKKNYFFTPKIVEMIQFDYRRFFKWVGEKPPIRYNLDTFWLQNIHPMLPESGLPDAAAKPNGSTIN